MTPLSSIAMSAYTDLVRLLKDDALSDVEGKPTLKERGDKAYWYAARRVGTEMRFFYIGEDSDETRARIERIEELRATAKERQAERSRLVRLLRAEGMTPTDRATGSILSAMAAAGTFRLGGTIVGTNAFRLYEGELGIRLPLGGIANTGDIDIAQFEKLSIALQDQVAPGLAETFTTLKFDPVPGLDKGRIWRWAQGGSGQLVEFLTPAFGNETIRDLPALGVGAQALNYLNFPIAEPIHAAAIYRSGILVQVPRPERYAIHKLIIADRRRDGAGNLKSAKDREQAAFLIEAMAEDRPDELSQAYATALEVGPRWREHIGNSLKRMPETKTILESLDA
ncbi:GSU2403 family nucleotidyltransferase fold protein [Sedimentitalea sp. JM2-8]|uniref:GSU2403 family nucleotidyltransferase fold protein n=2 Tax=Sedimentitalea xiamensis TaxID=3050037 RepID=A0ABT7FK56_9RHOB|nr:GSU2403 family nucleotidyltransferase fold protein [Sedimentitalea xiamensis]